MSWSDGYLGLPYRDLGRDVSGCDCWGLVHLVYGRELKTDLPTYAHAYHSTDERAEIARLIGEAERSSIWHRVYDPEPFDLVTFRRGRLTSHIGIVIRPDWMLHMPDSGARIENYRLPSWQQRLIGIWRHEERMA